MNINGMTVWAELKYKVLLTAVMISDGYSDEDVIEHLLNIAELIDNNQPRR